MAQKLLRRSRSPRAGEAAIVSRNRHDGHPSIHDSEVTMIVIPEPSLAPSIVAAVKVQSASQASILSSSQRWVRRARHHARGHRCRRAWGPDSRAGSATHHRPSNPPAGTSGDVCCRDAATRKFGWDRNRGGTPTRVDRKPTTSRVRQGIRCVPARNCEDVSRIARRITCE